ncbi:hypothetical protein KSS87_018007 [Heliosperma pusillum]|nr:hypothetical protein KSS87_018007 [Heliosperma pusillum]
MADLATKEREEEENDNVTAEDEDTGAQIAPIVKLEEVTVTTGEEDEDPLLDLKSKLYRFDKEGNQWKERGSGTVKFLKHKETGKVRLVMRQSKTLKICANHLIIAGMTVQEHAGNDKSCVWHASDYADKELKDEMFCIRFATVENCKKFMEMFQEVAESQQPQGESSEASETAEALEKLSVGDSDKVKAVESETKTEAKPETETATKKEDDVKVDEKKTEDSSA